MFAMRPLQKKEGLPNWEKTIIWFLAGQGISQLGSGLVQFALIWYVTIQTNSGSSLMVITIASFLPQLTIALFAGVWADRFNRRWIIILADAGIAFATLVIALLFIFGYEHVWQIYLVSAIRSLGGGIQGPAVTATIPQIVPREQLVRYNGIQSTIGNTTQLLSPILGGAVMAFLPMYGIFFIDVATAAIAITILIFLKTPKRYAEPLSTLSASPAAAQPAVSSDIDLEPAIDSNLASLKEGLTYIRESELISRLMLIYGGFMVLLSPTIILMPLYIGRNFGDEAWRLTVAQSSLFGGMMLGGLIVSWIGKFKNKLNIVQFAGFMLALTSIALGLLGTLSSPLFLIFGAIAFAAGTIVPFYTTNVTVLLQEETPPDRHGRVFAVLFMIGSAAIPAGIVLFGPLANLIPIEAIMFITGSLQLLLVFMSRRMLPAVKEELEIKATAGIESAFAATMPANTPSEVEHETRINDSGRMGKRDPGLPGQSDDRSRGNGR